MWQKLKELKFERAAVVLYRSNTAMEQWKVATEYRNGDEESCTYNVQSDAYAGFYNAARVELDHDKYMWEAEVRVC